MSDVDTFFAELKHPQKRELLLLREIILGADPAIREGIKWKAPSFSTHEDFATLHLRARDGVQVILHLGVKPRPDATVREQVSDPAALLAWRGADRAIATFHDLADIQARRAAFEEILRQWIRCLCRSRNDSDPRPESSR